MIQSDPYLEVSMDSSALQVVIKILGLLKKKNTPKSPPNGVKTIHEKAEPQRGPDHTTNW